MASNDSVNKQKKRGANGAVKTVIANQDTGVGGRTRARTAVSVSAPVVHGGGSFPVIGPLPHHPLESSRKRAKTFGGGAATGDRRIVEDDFNKFKKQKLKEPARTHFLQHFSQAAKVPSTSFVTHATQSTSSGGTAHEYFGIVEPVKGALSGRSVDTPLSSGFLQGVNNSSHPLPLSAVRNQHQVNKSSLVFSENAIANQGGARVAEEFARNQANDLGALRVALVTRTSVSADESRPSQVERAVLVRSKSGNNISLLGGFSHDNDKRDLDGR